MTWSILPIVLVMLIGVSDVENELNTPPWTRAPDETSLPSGVTLPACESAVARLSTPMGAKVVSKQYSHSATWGDILRAQMSTPLDGNDSFPFQIMCWGAGKNMQLWVNMMGPQPAP